MTLKTETSLETYADLDTWPLARTLEAIVDSNAAAVEAVRQALPELERAAAGIKRALTAGGRLLYLGAGTSGGSRCKTPPNCRRPLGSDVSRRF